MSETALKPFWSHRGYASRLLRISGLLSVALLLAACGRTGTGDSGGDSPPPAPTPDPLLEFSYTLPESTIGPNTSFVYTYLTEITDEYQGRTEPTERMPVPSSRELNIRLDAETIPAEFSIERFFGYYLPQLADGPAPFTVSDADVTIRPINSMAVTQTDPTVANGYIYSHNIEIHHEAARDSGTEPVFQWPVFSSGEATVRASYARGVNDYEVEINLVPGWNLLHSDWEFIDDRWRLIFGSHDSSVDFHVVARPLHRHLGTLDLGYSIGGLTVFTLDDVQSATPVEPIDMRQFEAGPGVRPFGIIGWLPPDMAAAVAHPLETVIGSATGTMTGTDDLRVTATAIYTFPPGSSDVSDPAASNGRIVFVHDDGYPVLLVYADRSATIHMDDVTLADGTELVTPAGGLPLVFGWNTIVIQPIADTGVHLLDTVYSWTVPLEGREH